jgi:hypothetical protein
MSDITITLIVNTGDGTPNSVTLSGGTTVGQMLTARDLTGTVRVNRQSVDNTQVLVDGDQVSVTPTNVKMAMGLEEAIGKARLEQAACVEAKLAAAYIVKENQLIAALEASTAEGAGYSNQLKALSDAREQGTDALCAFLGVKVDDCK